MTDIHALAGAYALDAVTDIERVQFQRHLDQCETCALEVAELSETAARLTDATWTEPPPELRAAVLAQVSGTRQARPGRAGRSPGGRSRGGRSRGGGSRGGGPQAWPRWTLTAVAASVLAVAAGGAVYAVQEQRVQEERDRLAQIEAIVTAPDASVRSQAVESGTVTVIGSRQRDEAVVMLDALPAPRDDEAYQLWISAGDELTSAGVLQAGAGDATALITGYAGADAIGVSLERAGGSQTGTPTDVVALLPVS